MLRRLWFNLIYYQRPPWDTGMSPPELLNYIATRSPGKALDLGCGTGTNSISLAKAGWQVTSVDFAQRAIQIARNKARRAGVQVDFRLGDVTHLESLKVQFDLIFDLGCFHSLPPNDHIKYMANVERLLSPQGAYLMYVFFKNNETSLGPGIIEQDVESLAHKFELIQRTDSTERSFRPSAWFIFHKRM
ncbi:MAG TPA: class I SAM-dependent methyltransferase [Anaerolineales bacterium]